jgi:SAM-dependent methyltransferase
MDTAKDTEFYNEISATYSRDRYPARARSYGQFFFKRRLAKVLEVLREKISDTERQYSLLEVGCADGIVIRAIYDTFTVRFSLLHGVDISPNMIEAAKNNHAQTPIQFTARNTKGEGAPYDFVVEVGVINYTDVAEEIEQAYVATKDNGYYIASYAGKGSLLDRFKPGKKGFGNLVPYPMFEALARKKFIIEQVIPVGFFIPLLWRFPALAAPIQVVIESLCSRIFPNLAHEKIYIFKKII